MRVLATHRQRAQRGGTAMGVVIGLLVGLGIALIVAIWVTKVPVPFVNKVPPRSAESDAAEAERNRNWDPNAKLGGVRSSAPAAAPTAPVGPPAPGALPPFVPPVPPPTSTAPATGTTARATAPAAAPAQATAPATTAPKTSSGNDPFTYFVQAGAYTRAEDAEQQRGRLAILGYAAKVSEREQVGRTMYRVRLGPFDNKDVANATQAKLQQQGVDAALVAIEKGR